MNCFLTLIRKPLVLLILVLGMQHQATAQWSYIQAIDSSLGNSRDIFIRWLGSNGYYHDLRADSLATEKAAGLTMIFGKQLHGTGYSTRRQPVTIRFYIDDANRVCMIDFNLVNPAASEMENVQLVLIKSGFEIKSEIKDKDDNTTRTTFQNQRNKVSLISPDDRSYLIISAASLSLYNY